MVRYSEEFKLQVLEGALPENILEKGEITPQDFQCMTDLMNRETRLVSSPIISTA
jgi:hypothetical protein